MADATAATAKVYSRTVGDKSPAVKRMAERWGLVYALLGGTAEMRRQKSLLPRWPNEDEGAYSARLASSVLFPGYSRTVETLTGKPFSKPLAVTEKVPAAVRELLGDCDRQGRDLSAFAAAVMESALGIGGCGILVDCPPRAVAAVAEDGSQTVSEVPNTVAAEKAAGIRPYLVHIRADQVLGWKHDTTGGEARLTQLRIMECVEVDEDEFTTAEVEQVRVLRPGSWETWRKSNDPGHKDEWERVGQGATSLRKVPYVQVYGRREGFMEHRPPMMELAQLNGKHWQSQSDQDTILHVARVPILVVKGVDKEFEFTIGSSAAIKLPAGQEADMKWVEHTGAAIDAGRVALNDLKEEMRQSGAEMLVLKSGPVTATEVASDNSVGMCDLQRVTIAEEAALDQALRLMAEYLGTALEGEAATGLVEIFKDFGAASLSDAAAQLLLNANAAGKISDETLRAELKRRGILSADVDEEEEKERIEAQGPAPGSEDVDPLTGLPLERDPATGLPIKKPAPGAGE